MLVGDRYRLRRPIGEGGMGWVWEATEVATDRSVALKLLKSARDEDRKRFSRELRAAAAIRHPNVIAVHELLELPDGTLVIVMDLLEGETLAALLRREQRISLREVTAIFVPVLAALEAAHALGIVHRDVKPDNIYLSGTAGARDVKVLDFGIAKLTAEDGLAARTQALTGTGSMVGTPYYMSPEQVFADSDIDPRADTWSLGVSIYECLTGVRPTEAETVGRVLKRIMAADFEPISTHRTDLPEEVASLVARMLSADRAKRPHDLGVVRDTLLRCSGTHAPAPVPEDSAGRADTNRGVSVTRPRPSRTRTRLVAAGALATLALIGSAVYVRGRYEESAAARAPSMTEQAAPAAAPPASVTASPVLEPVAAPSTPPPIASAPGSASLAAASAATAKPAAAVISRPSCEKGEVLSEGHCCLRGHRWREGRCERPLATSF
jgi:hypothetical protein